MEMAETRQFGRIILAAHNRAHLCPIYHNDFKIRPGRDPKIGFGSWLLHERIPGISPQDRTRDPDHEMIVLWERYALFFPAQGQRRH
jgi:hypothetical protein